MQRLRNLNRKVLHIPFQKVGRTTPDAVQYVCTWRQGIGRLEAQNWSRGYVLPRDIICYLCTSIYLFILLQVPTFALQVTLCLAFRLFKQLFRRTKLLCQLYISTPSIPNYFRFDFLKIHSFFYIFISRYIKNVFRKIKMTNNLKQRVVSCGMRHDLKCD